MSVKDYTFEAGKFNVTSDLKADFDAKGYVLVRKLFNEEELEKLRSVLNEDDDVLKQYAYDDDDGTGRKIRMCLWSRPGDDVTGRTARCEKMAGTCAQLLGGEVEHYHSKLMMKDAFTGFRFMWHQDYGYWYNCSFPFPDLITVFIALDPCDQDNGCLEVLEGSHLCGRIEHKRSVEQVMGADVERVEQLRARCPQRQVKMEPGDALFFHCNLLHTSQQNSSAKRRWALLCAYNRVDNAPAKDLMDPFCTKITKVPDSAIVASKPGWDLDSTAFFTEDKRTEFWKDFEKCRTTQ